MQTFGEKGKIILEKGELISEIKSFRHLANRVMQTAGINLPGGGIINNKFDLNKQYYLSPVNKGVGTFGLGASKELDDSLHDFQTYCDINNPNGAYPLLMNIAKRALPLNYISPYFNVPMIDPQSGKFTYHHVQIVVNNVDINIRVDGKSTTTPDNIYRSIYGQIKELEKYLNYKVAGKNINWATKGPIISTMNEMKDVANKIKKAIVEFEQYGQEPRVKTADNTKDMFTDKGEILEIAIPEFLEELSEKALVTARRSFGSGFSLDTIFTGYVGTTRTGQTAFLRQKEEIAVHVSILETIHNTIMVPIFVKPRKLLYATQEQYKRLLKGGIIPRFGQAVGAVANQIYQAGAQAPKTRV